MHHSHTYIHTSLTQPTHLSSSVQNLTTLSHPTRSPSLNSAATSTFNGESGCGSVNRC